MSLKNQVLPEKTEKAEQYKQHLLSRAKKLKILTQKQKNQLQQDWKIVEEIIDENRSRQLFRHH